ncbi:MAG: hypothetical protein AMXMBFR20_36480 [Planctomycetia bacterium]
MAKETPPTPHGPMSRPTLNPTAIAVDDAARLLGAAAGQHVSEAMILADIDAGAPVNGDGSINLIHYAAWIVREMSGRGD